MNRIIQVKVIPKAKNPGVFEEDGFLKVKVHSPPEKGKANKEVVESLANYFGIKRSDILLVDGESSQYKTFMIRNS